MNRMVKLVAIYRFPLTALLVLFAICGTAATQSEQDPHRPACTTAQCRKIKAFLKTHYCGDSPYGNGPDDGCLIKIPKSKVNVEIVANYHCEWNDAKGSTTCKQQGQPSPEIRTILIRELHKLGLPSDAKGQTFFRQWNHQSSGNSLATADYSYVVGSDLELCQVAILIGQNSPAIVLRKVKFHKTNADVPDGITWPPVDVANASSDGQAEIIFEADAYEDHWLEVVRVENGVARTIFSGLGYYL